MTTAEAALYLRYQSRGGVLMAVRRGALKAVGKRGRILLFRREDLDAMIRPRSVVRAGELIDGTHKQEEARSAGSLAIGEGQVRVSREGAQLEDRPRRKPVAAVRRNEGGGADRTREGAGRTGGKRAGESTEPRNRGVIRAVVDEHRARTSKMVAEHGGPLHHRVGPAHPEHGRARRTD
ncbi:MAG: helix-turn-helix domain-containing protein [Deltaproteobacteria bacterium]|nr:helix-turn-helix domain-containing protein [Deltaproteobacteria bacterium]